MRTTSPIDATFELMDSLEHGEDLPDDIREWLLRALKLYAWGQVRTLDEGLGLAVGPGKGADKLCNVWRRRQRNHLIREAAYHMTGLTKCQRAKIISDAMTTDIHDVESREARIHLTKLRRLCTDERGDPAMAIGWKSVSEILKFR